MYVMHGVHEQPFQKMGMGALMQVAYASVVQQSSLYFKSSHTALDGQVQA